MSAVSAAERAGSPAASADGFRDPISNLLVKVAARCNIDCSYCYWFRDPSVYARPKLMSRTVLTQMLARVEDHVVAHELPVFPLLLHGGEPMLWGMENYDLLGMECRAIAERTGCVVSLTLTTNGVLIDDAWIDCFERNEIGLTISIDGPAEIHDIHRRTFQGAPTHAAVERAIRLLQARGISFGTLAVCNPAYPAETFFDYFRTLGLESFDIIFPDAVHGDDPPSIAAFYSSLFDLWLDANRDRRAVRIRTVESMVSGLLAGPSPCEVVGYGPIEVCTIMTDGSMEPLDVLRIAGEDSTRTTFNLFDNAIEEIKNEPRWMAARASSLQLCETCQRCQFKFACGGSYLPHRFSKANGYDNPSVYCEDLYSTFSYIQSKLAREVYVATPAGDKIEIGQALSTTDS